MTRRTVWSGTAATGVVHTPVDQWEGDWRGESAVDLTGRPIEPGMWLAKAFTSGRSCNLEIRKVREVRTVVSKDWDGKKIVSQPRVFLDDSKVPVQYPGRCLIVDWDPAAETLPHPRAGAV